MGGAYRNRSMPIHSRMMASQKPWIKSSAAMSRARGSSESAFGSICRMTDDRSVARRCCTSGLSDIQKPERNTRDRHTRDRRGKVSRRTVKQALPQSAHFHGRQLSPAHIPFRLFTGRQHATGILDRRRKLGDPAVREERYHVGERCVADFFVCARGVSRGRAKKNLFKRTGVCELFSEGEDGARGEGMRGLGLWSCAADRGDGGHGVCVSE